MPQTTIVGQNLPYILIVIVATIMAVFVAAPFHEFAHAYAAKKEGDYTAVACGRYTLAPLAHFDWTGFFMLLIFRFGWAKPVPVDSRNFKNGRKSQLKVACAGIIANLILGTFFLFMYLFILKIRPAFYESSYYGLLVGSFLEMSVSLNFMLAFFNLLPLYPLDGYKIIDSFCKFENSFLQFMKKHSMWIYLIVIFTSLYSIYYTYTAGVLVDWLIKLFSWMLRL